MSLTAPLAALLLAAGTPGCVGKVLGVSEGGGPAPMLGSGGSSSGGAAAMGGDSAMTTSISSLSCDGHVVDPGPAPLRLLSRQQYMNTVKALAGDVPGLDEALGDEVTASAFGLVQPDVTQVQLEHFQKAADTIAAAVVGNMASMNQLAPCAAGAAPADCAKSMLQKFGTLAYRAPITDQADIDRHLQLFTVGAATSYQHGIEMLLRGMLQSPRFLYRVEVGTSEKVGDSAVKLSGYEVAARLSYTLWDAPPSDQLYQAAAAGALANKDGVAQQLSWMLQDPRGQKLVSRFLQAWMHTDSLGGLIKDATAYPEFQAPSFKSSMQNQAAAFFDDLLANQGGKLNALFTSQTVFYNRDLGSYYGMGGGDTFASMQKTDGTVFGMLTLPAVLAVQAKPDQSSPIYRGRFVREALLCQQLPAPPANVPPAPSVMPGVSTRERSAEHEVNAACSGCHQLLDPIGFGFENYDAIGRFRTQDGGKAVDASGNVVQTRDMDGAFNGLGELSQKLAQSGEVKECVMRQWFRYAINRFEQPVDGCSVKSVLDSFETAGQDLNSLPLAIVQTDAFLYRRPSDAQVQP